MIICSLFHLSLPALAHILLFLCSFMAFPGSEIQGASLHFWLSSTPQGCADGPAFLLKSLLLMWFHRSNLEHPHPGHHLHGELSAGSEGEWLTPHRHFYCGLSDGFRVAGPLLPTPNPKWISSLARGWKESDWVISSSGNSPWQQFKAAWKTGQQVATIWISKAS